MSDPEVLEEYCLEHGIYEEVFGKPAESSHLYKAKEQEKTEISHKQENPKKTGPRGQVEYEMDKEGNLREVVVGYNIEGKRYELSLVVNDYGVSGDHIRLEVRKKNKNPLKNILDQNLLASSVTPIHVKAYQRGCLWESIKENKMKYPSDARYSPLVSAAIEDIKSMSDEIEKKKKYIAYRQSHLSEENAQRERQDMEEENRKEQKKLKDKKIDPAIINFFRNRSRKH